MRQNSLVFMTTVLGAMLAASSLQAQGQAQSQGGRVVGTVTNAKSTQPLGGVQILIAGTNRGTVSRADGSFVLLDVPAGIHTVSAMSIGYKPVRLANVVVAKGDSVRLTLLMDPSVLSLHEVVITGLVDPTEGVRSPITIAKVTKAMMPVMPTGSAINAIQGKVAGAQIIRTTGQPGTETNVILRTPTSIRGSNTPMMVVDGVILGSGAADIESADIESIEVIKGAAAASLYGSRAASGVISITTNRGRGLASGKTKITVRNETGQSYVKNFQVPTVHPFAVNAAGFYVDRLGQRTDRTGRYEPAVAFMENAYPTGTPLFDNVNTLYRPGAFGTQNLQVEQNSDRTNFAASVNRQRELGALQGNNGYTRNAFRVNLDHRFLSSASLGISAYHSRAERDEPIGGVGLLGSQYWDFLAAPIDLDLSRKDADGNFVMQPDPAVPYENPIWRQNSRSNTIDRNRTLLSGTLKWEPLSWLTVSGNGSYDRQDDHWNYYLAKGVPTSVVTLLPATGYLETRFGRHDTFNYSIDASARKSVGRMTLRTTVRGLWEKDTDEGLTGIGQDFFVTGVPRMNAAGTRTTSSTNSQYAATGYLNDWALDYDGKYIATVLLRRDGSSLFGPENRWHSYYRTAFAYRMGQESWFHVPHVDELKLRVSQGTAGGRPDRTARFETWNVSAAGVTKGQLGNSNLRPEQTRETEFGLDLILFNRLSVEVVHARQQTNNSLVLLPVSAITGYSSQWTNSGAMAGHTTELRLESQILDRKNLKWSTQLIADRSRSKITEWDQICLVENISRVCKGTSLRDIYGFRFLKGGRDQLLPALQSRSAEFDTNDEGYTVWVGAGNSWRDGVAKQLWGTQTVISGRTLGWGMPIVQSDSNNIPVRQFLGSGDPALNMGWLNTVHIGNLTLFGHFHAALGQKMLNDTRKNLLNGAAGGAGRNSDVMDQTGKTSETKKPTSYYVPGLLQSGLPTEAWLEDNSFVKLRSLSARFRFTEKQLGRVGLNRFGADGLTVGLEGRDLFTWTKYWGFDPEGGLIATNRVAPLNWFAYPPTRTFTASFAITF